MVTEVAICGGGLSGLSLARMLVDSDSSLKVNIYERSNRLGGNLAETNIGGTIVHEHGPHIFHTNSEKVWSFLQEFSDWTPYFHRVTCCVHGNFVPVPFNFMSIDTIFGDQAGELKALLLKHFEFGSRVPILKLMETDDDKLNYLANFIFSYVFKGYSEKQWGKPTADIDRSVLSRVPVVMSYDDRYFADKYQFIPTNGYNKLVENLANHASIKTHYGVDIRQKELTKLKEDLVFYTGAIDEFFDYEAGRLEYRSLKFQQIEKPEIGVTKLAVQTNFPNEFGFTRITRYGILDSQTANPVYVAELPCAYERDDQIKYYPVSNEKNNELYKYYKGKIDGLPKKLQLLGRLADYKYFNMDQAVGRALMIGTKFLENKQ